MNLGRLKRYVKLWQKYKSKPKGDFALSEVVPTRTVIRRDLIIGTPKTIPVIICVRVVILDITCDGLNKYTLVVTYAQFRRSTMLRE